MKPIAQFYQLVLDYIQADHEMEGAIEGIISLAEKASPSWEATKENLELLEKCCARGDEVSDEVWSSSRNDFAKAAFRDLSPLRDSGGMMDVLHTVSTSLFAGDLLIWARTIKERADGSGVIVTHVSNLDLYRDLIENHDNADTDSTCHSLEEGVLIGE